MSDLDIHIFGGARPLAARDPEMTVRQYAQYEGVTERTVRNWIEKKAVRVRRTPGGGVRIILGAMAAEKR